MPSKPRPKRLTVIHYVLPNGTRVSKSTPGATRKKTTTTTYYATMPGERKPTSLGTSDEGEAWEVLRRMLKERAERSSGIRTTELDAAGKPTEEHIAAWQSFLTAKGTGKDHVTTVGNHVRRLARIAGWERITDIDADSAVAALAKLRDAGRSAQTRNHYLGHLKEFCRWCCLSTPRRLRDNPVEGLRRVNVEEDPRRPHRLPTAEEITQLFKWLGTGREPAHARQHTTYPADGSAPVRRYMSGPHRALGYRIAMGTGLRAKEIRSLRRESFDLDAATVSVSPAVSKHRRRNVQPLPDWLRDELKAHFDSGGGDWRKLNDGGEKRSKNVLKSDLEDCGIAFETDEGCLTLHSLRVYYITRLALNPENTVKEVMELARHSTPHLTLKIYARLRDEDKHRAARRLERPDG